MALSLKPSALKYYRDIALLFWKYGRADLVRESGIEGWLAEEGDGRPEPARDPQEFVRDLEKLGPTFVKLGQLLSTRPDLIAEPYVEALSRLQDDMAPFPYEDVERVVQHEVGIRIHKAFRSFDKKPLAAASLGQVHRAVLHDGRDVVVKIQRPEIRQKVAEDLSALGDLATLIDAHTAFGRRYNLRGIFLEFRKVLMRELSYRQEAANLRTLRRNLAEFEHIRIPEPIAGFCTDRVLAMSYISGHNLTKLNPVVMTDADGTELVNELFRAYLKQVLVDGFFHADPHPGNVYLTHDRKIALLDLGMVAHVSPLLRQHLLQLLLAITDGRSDQVVVVAQKITNPTEDFDAPSFSASVEELVNAFQQRDLGELDVGRLLMEITQACTDNGMRVPSELTMLGKALLNLDRIGRILDRDFDPNEAIRREASAILRGHILSRFSVQAMSSALLEVNDFASRFPQRLNTIMDRLAENRLRIEVDAIDEGTLLRGAHKIANRITVGLLLSSLVIGAALLLRTGGSSFHWLSYQGLAVVFFILAASGAVALIWTILFRDREDLGDILKRRHPRVR